MDTTKELKKTAEARIFSSLKTILEILFVVILWIIMILSILQAYKII